MAIKAYSYYHACRHKNAALIETNKSNNEEGPRAFQKLVSRMYGFGKEIANGF